MKLRLIFMAVLTGFSGISMAAVSESCPEASAVRHTAGIYTASANTVGAEWLGVVSSKDPQGVESFEVAVFYAGMPGEESLGRLSKCTYVSGNGDRVDMHFRREQTSEVPVRLKSDAAWERKSGPFGMIVYECRNAKKDGCEFEVANHQPD